jgi:protein gp37
VGEFSKIGWTHHTLNPWWGCVEVSAECDNCYARELDGRWRSGEHWGPDAPRLEMSEAYWKQPLKWDRAAARAGERHRVFCASMADIFEKHRNPEIDRMLDAQRARVWDLISKTTNLDWLLLTKRPNMIGQKAPKEWVKHGFPRNVWLGVTVGHEATEWRLARLIAYRAVVRFCSYEPALGPVDFEPWCMGGTANRSLDWIIGGEESGRRGQHRPTDRQWFRDVRDAAHPHGVAFFLKQFVNNGIKIELPLLDGERFSQIPQPVFSR